MSARLLKKVLKEQEQQQRQRFEEEEDEEQEEAESPVSANRPAINPFDLLNNNDDDDPDPDQVSFSNHDLNFFSRQNALFTYLCVSL